MKMPPGTPRSRSFTRFTMRVALPHLGQSVLLVVSITFLRSAVLAILAISSPVFWCAFILPYAVSSQHSAFGPWHPGSANSAAHGPWVRLARNHHDPGWLNA